MGILYLIFLFFNVIQATDYIPSESILLNCGSFDTKTTDSNGRKWISDNNSKFLLSSKGSFRATATTQAPDVSTIPYMSARVFYSNITYSFPVSSSSSSSSSSSGRKFLRIYFYPNKYSRSNSADSRFSVSVGSYSLLQNFNPFEMTQDLGVDYLIKEYSINVQGGVLSVTFTPWEKSFGFVNGIEVVSMPSIYDNVDGVNIVGASSPFQIDNSTALETLYRLNVGGNYIQPTKDTGLFRSWYDDSAYISGSQRGMSSVIDPDVSITFPESIPSYVAPINVYSTARFMTADNELNLKFNLTWSFPIQSGFAYLVRFHFCQIFSNIHKVNQIVFNLYLNNLTAFSGLDVIALAQNYGFPYILDFVVILPTTQQLPRQDLWVALHPDSSDRPQYYNAFLNGLEILKINNTDGSL